MTDNGNLFEGLHVPTEEEYLYCIRCGLCLSACPIYREHLIETQSPRGRVALIRKMVEGDLKPSPYLTDQMYQCMACLACNTACPVGINPADLVLQTRALLEEHRPHWWKRPLFRGFFMHPAVMAIATWHYACIRSLGCRKLSGLGPEQSTARTTARYGTHGPGLPGRPLRDNLPKYTAQRRTTLSCGILPGCIQSLMFADGSSASVEVMARNGCEVVTPKRSPAVGCHPWATETWKRSGKCTPQHRCFAGLNRRHRHRLRHMRSTLKEYAKIRADDPQYAADAAVFAAKVRDISEFLMEIPLETPRARLPCESPITTRAISYAGRTSANSRAIS